MIFFKNKYDIKYQLDSVDCGAACLSMVSNYYGINYGLGEFKELMYWNREGVSLLEISEIAEKVGFRTRGVKITLLGLLREVQFPCILHWRENHFVVLYKTKRSFGTRKYLVADPGAGKIWLREEEFISNWLPDGNSEVKKGVVLTLEPTPQFFNRKIGFSKTKKGIKYVLRYLNPYGRLIIQLILGLTIGSILQLAFPFLAQATVDVGINLRNVNFINLILVGQLFFVAARLSTEVIRRWILLHISTRINISIISDFLIKLLKLPLGFFDSKMIGDILQRIKDHERIETFLTSSTISILFSVVNIIIFGSVLAFYNVPIFLIFATGSVAYILWILIFMNKRKEIDYAKFKHYSENQSIQLQLITGVHEIKLNNCENRKRWEWEHVQAKLFKSNIEGLKLEQVQSIGGALINELKNILITFMAAQTVINGEITMGMMLAIQYINGQLNVPITNLIEFAYSFQNAKIALERLEDVHLRQDEDEKNANKLVNIPQEKSISLSNITFRFGDPHAKKIIDNLSIYIPEGKITAIVGVSGSGKTTLIKLLLGFYQPEDGEIQVGGTLLSSINSRFWRANCGAVLQDGFIFSDTIYQNIVLGNDSIDTTRLQNAISIANLDEFVNNLPLKYNTKIGSEGVGISAGQKQRILIARVIYRNPQFIFLDEATNALDAENERNILEELTQFFIGKTVVVVAHRLSTVRNADQIIVLDKGKTVEVGRHEDLIGLSGKYYDLIKDQLEIDNYEYKN